MGPSGSGKSTLLRVIAGQQVPDSGLVHVSGTPVVQSSWDVAGDPRVACVYQDYRLVPFISIADNVRLASEVRGRRSTRDDIAEALKLVGLSSIDGSRLPGTLSGGEQQRLALARAMLTGADVLLADEPTGALDEANSRSVAELLGSLAHERGVAVVVATHDPTVADAADHVHRLVAGRLVAGQPTQGQ